MRGHELMLSVTIVLSLLTVAGPALAQQIDAPWSFTRQNRAQIAVAVKQMKDQRETAIATAQASAPKNTTIVCGGGSSTASANSTCIILNEATGQIATEQLSDGSSQSATNQIDAGTGADEVLELLGQ